ncbi:MAG TPA: PEGA domain-containing protein [Polyangiaceae bacterium]|nr:PEGA domain-containing protein [Polyangiaceae bacterium]
MAISFKERGDQAMDKGDFAAAAEAYRQGNQIQHHPAFDFNLARALQGLGRFAEALDSLERFGREATPELLARVPGFDAMLAELQGNVGELILDGVPKAAKVTGNARDLGEFEPGRRIRCNRGMLELSIVSEGYEPISRRVTIVAGKPTRVSVEWRRVDDRATIRIDASVPAARVSIDGRSMGQTPLEARLRSGSHHLRLDHPDCPALETDIVVRPRESRRLTIEMPHHAPLWAKWWFWTSAAALAAGIVIAGVALSSSKPATAGDIQPGIVSAPLVAP